MLVDNVGRSEKHLDSATPQNTDHFGECLWPVNIIGILIGRKLPGGAAQSFIEGMALTAIGFRDPIRKPWFIFLKDLDGVIRRATIDYDILQVRITLKKNGTNGFFKEFALIVRRSNDADPWPGFPAGNRIGKLGRPLGPWPARFASGRGRKIIYTRTVNFRPLS
jgi:hypothetical protein